MEESFLKKLNGKNNDEISSALWVLLHTPGKSKYLKQIIPHLKNKVTDVRLPATMVIANIKDRTTIPHLEILLKDNNELIRIEAALALAKYNNINCYTILKGIIEKDHKDHSIHKRTIEALGKFKDKKLLPIFKIGLFHRRNASRYKSIEAIERTGAKESIVWLKEALNTEKEPIFKEKIRRIIEQHESDP